MFARSAPSTPREVLDRRSAARLASRLSGLGHDALHTSALPDGNRSTDQRIALLADQESRIVVTKDVDFRNSHLLAHSPTMLLVVATGNIGNNDLLNLVESRLEQIEKAFELSSHVELRRDAVLTYPRSEP